ncbi:MULTISPECIES: helix-turn-helix transcriptional regulator [Streptomyces]|uniref:Helix-turn-helix transcriptional regulator n=1 Tax=Streptomyces edwardsiae TaxID=3075527 RepID=A0ABU2Q4C0_9ACTN|nr:helix-turn-helix transcriptional regulator [Streptomyces sp. DSM 41636]MDT0398887.1 helix-turn-helix transcriptional regulator [Streptomyces sp. DSM 41636]
MTQPSRDLNPVHSARDLYGVELHRQRQLAGLSLDRLSDIVNYSKTHLHGVETGERLPLPPISEKLDMAFGTGELFQGLWGAVKREHTPKRFGHCLELEARAVRIQEFSASLVPGLLQTEAYMRALFTAGESGKSPKEIDGLVADRLGRQEILRRDCPPDFWWILGEAALRQVVGGSAVMRGQLSALLPLVRTRHSTIQVSPFNADGCALMSGTLILLTLPDNSTTMYLEGGGNYGEAIDEREAVTRYVREYDLKKACALSPQESATLIETMLETCEPCESPGT